MHQVHQKTQDQILLLDWLEMASEEQLVDEWAWRAKNITQQYRWQAEDLAHEEVWDWVDCVFTAWILAGEEQHL
ncbi:hypothetical protein Y1Q_0022535 [Alligator mississippiensis]|uniref:Uncharacterized protein n=1 Tax=Alligator mississippiensis TaxID=8496 RepID=A0A151NWI2_ALLMI|nr:hypothetical protein Y1Q_0022535 [Alligator mississippiensis]